MENYVGKRLDGRYEIMEIIGVGGMAVVYKAFDNIDHRIVAVKILKNEFIENEEFRRRFKNESKAIAVLSHPNIVKVFDVSYGNMLQYIVMEHVEGITLKDYILQQGKVNPREAIYYITQILRALQHAHDKGIVHRDIKPQNIMLISDGTIKVTDFGIARFSRSETRTMTDGAIGSVHYISPEQAKGSLTDAKTDLYSVGVMLYEMLTGRLPFQSDNAVSVALMQLQNEPTNPREINPDIPVGLEQIIMRAMQKNQNDRYQSASEILRDIEEFKKNPNIKFNYSYYAEPKNQYAISDDNDTLKENVIIPTEEKATENASQTDDEAEETHDMTKSKTIAVLGGVLAALVIFAVVLLSLFSPGKEKVSVPSLVGLNFYSDIMDNETYNEFSFEPIIDSDSEEEAGQVINQEPSSGKVEKGTVITLYISGYGSETEVPDVEGYEYSSAESVLKSYGFDVMIEREVDTSVEKNKVIRTEPAGGKKVTAGSVVTIFVATDEIIETVAVPNLIGLTVSQARSVLADAGLYLDGANTEYRGSTERAGTIIGYEHIGEEVDEGTGIAVYVSTGEIPETTADHEHEYEVIKEKKATCTDDGYKKTQCTICEETEKEVLKATGHTKVKLAAVKATCTKTGLTKGSKCEDCGQIFTAQEVIPALGHTEVKDEAVAASCASEGLTEGSHCSVCNKVIVKQEKIAKLEHKVVADAAVAPSCSKTGLTAGSHCSECGEIITAQEVVAATAHADNNGDGACDSCQTVIATTAAPTTTEATTAETDTTAEQESSESGAEE